MRELQWDGGVNIRDLGGLRTPLSVTGVTVRCRVARGPRRERLTDSGWNDARQWGLAIVVDLRCAHETGSRDTDPSVRDGSHNGVSIVSAPTEDHDNAEFRRVCFPLLDSPEYWAHNWRILPGLVRSALVAIADARPGVLVHCSAGRDRTGMITALLLGNAGVAPEHVVDDYAQSVHAMAGVPHQSPTGDRQYGWSSAQREEWIDDVSPIVHDVAIHTSDALDVIGLESAYRQRLRDLLTVR
ncbi:tyrosine-protein phosphatase [Paramicrobacterium chengjingii]|uniref:Tyrosine-protein phosphatase n=1 Tax=Paramicrobacterium chengjingii TaxID=2769067 RepID=A0ABX6YME6_9MICO|nr:tyrosine-protein phosphatase [Microbacterium chengjingii]QPZ39897.1 tyrosine-protein phosphatase [Microbacterium chengjingii]